MQYSRVVVAAGIAAVLGSTSLPAFDRQSVTQRGGTIPRDTARERRLVQQVRAPEGFTVTLFAAPPVAMYPTCLTSAPDGSLFVCVDPNLSLGADKGRGRIVRLVDADNDGVADRYTTFAEMDSPRGVIHDGQTLFVMHPPNLTAYRDSNSDGFADTSENLVTGLGFDLDFRGADHSTNGITLGIDGWIYIAVGDYGYRAARGKDGTTIRHHGGSVVRVRTDGSGLEIYGAGTRNIYDVAVDPFLNIFTRDNTNDGDGWDTRLHYVAPNSHMGYPTLYRNFADEHMPSLADYGGGAGTAGLWLHDAAFPQGFGNTLYTGDWTVNRVFRHPLTVKGASFEAGQEQFLTIPHPADMAADGRGHMFVSSLFGGQFTYQGDTIGFVVRISPPGASNESLPSYATLSNDALVTLVVSDNGEQRLQAQRELLRRDREQPSVQSLTLAIQDQGRPAYARVAAMFTLRQLIGGAARPILEQAAQHPGIAPLALQALVDDRRSLGGVGTALFVRALSDSAMPVRRAGIHGLVRLGAASEAGAIVPLTASPDRALAHLATRALVSLNASQQALYAVAGGPADVRRGALRALQQMHTDDVVRALAAMYPATTDATARQDLLFALARLHTREKAWDERWWGTRPNFVGPYFEPEEWSGSAISGPVLQAALLAAVSDSARLEPLASEYARNRILPAGASYVMRELAASRDPLLNPVVVALTGSAQLRPGVAELLANVDARNPGLHGAVASLIASQTALQPEFAGLAGRGALDANLDADVRGQLIALIGRAPGRQGTVMAAGILSQIVPDSTTAEAIATAWRRFLSDRRRQQEIDVFAEMSREANPGRRALAFAVLVQQVRGNRVSQSIRNRVTPILDSAWLDRPRATDLARAIGIVGVEAQYSAQLAAHRRGGLSGSAASPTAYPAQLAAQLAAQLGASPAQTASAGASASSASSASFASAAPSASPTTAGQQALRATVVPGATAADWVQLFNGRDLSGWSIKFAKHPLGENFNDTFRASDGLLKVAYDKWTGFNGEFGHIFYSQPFSHYIVAVEYRFVGEQVTGAGRGNSWAIRNNGIMIHSQSAGSMGENQDFPISLEVQLLGGLGSGRRTTGNLCTPGTHVEISGRLTTTHCMNSSSATFDGDAWVRVEAHVFGDSLIRHIVNGDTVLTYAKPRMGGGSANNTQPGLLVDGKPLTEGYITLQAETAPIEFRKVELLNLSGCMDRSSPQYRSWFVHSNPAACRTR